MRLTWISLTALAAAALVSATAEMSVGPDPATATARMAASSRLQSRTLLRMSPVHVLWTVSGLLGGLVLRDRVPLGRSHSSPAAAWVAKRGIAASAVAIAAFGLGALRVDPGWIHAAAAIHAGGWLAYVRNLPAKL